MGIYNILMDCWNKQSTEFPNEIQFVHILGRNRDSLKLSLTKSKNPPIGIIVKRCIIISQAFKIQESRIIYGIVSIDTDFKLTCNGLNIFPLSDSQFSSRDPCCQFSQMPTNLKDHKYYICNFSTNDRKTACQELEIRRDADGNYVYISNGLNGSPIVYIKDRVVNVVGFHLEGSLLNTFSKIDNQLPINQKLNNLISCRPAINNPPACHAHKHFKRLKLAIHKIQSQNNKEDHPIRSSLESWISNESYSFFRLEDSKQSIVHQINDPVIEKQIKIIINGNLSAIILELDKLLGQIKDKKMCADFNLSKIDLQGIDGKPEVRFVGDQNRMSFSLEDEWLLGRLRYICENDQEGEEVEEQCIKLFGQNLILDPKVRSQVEGIIQKYKNKQKRDEVIKLALAIVRQNAQCCKIRQFQTIIKKMQYIYKTFMIRKDHVKKVFCLDYIFNCFKYLQNATKEQLQSKYKLFIQQVKDLHNSEIHVKDLKDNKPIKRLFPNWLNNEQHQQFQNLVVDHNKAMHEYLRSKKSETVAISVAISEMTMGTSVIFKNPEKHLKFEDIIKTRQSLLQEQLLDVIACLVKGNMQLQQRHILHNDLKLANVIKIGDAYKIIDLQQSLYCLYEKGIVPSDNRRELYESNKKLFQFYIRTKQRSLIKPRNSQFKQQIFYGGLNQTNSRLPNLIDYTKDIDQIIKLQLENHAHYFRNYSPRKLQVCLQNILNSHPINNIAEKLKDEINNLSDTQCPQRENKEKYSKLLEKVKKLRQTSMVSLRESQDQTRRDK